MAQTNSSFSVNLQIEESVPTPQTEWKSKLVRAAQTVLAQARVSSETKLSIVLADDQRLQELNRQFAGNDKSADVLSFPVEPDELRPEDEMYIGDVIISVERAAQHAHTGGHPLLAELQLLTIHGVLHLLGHVHAHPKEKADMWRAQTSALNAINASISAPSD